METNIKRDDVIKVINALKSVVNDFASNHEAYFAGFKALWETTITNVNNFAEAALREPRVVFTDEAQKSVYAPYEFLQILMYTRLMDHLTVDEEDWFMEMSPRLVTAWQVLMSAFPAHHPDLAAKCDEAYQQFLILHEEVYGLFMGDLPPALTPKWAKSLKAVKSLLAEIAKGVEQ